MPTRTKKEWRKLTRKHRMLAFLCKLGFHRKRLLMPTITEYDRELDAENSSDAEIVAVERRLVIGCGRMYCQLPHTRDMGRFWTERDLERLGVAVPAPLRDFRREADE